jgi:glutamyl-tRNA synthetase
MNGEYIMAKAAEDILPLIRSRLDKAWKADEKTLSKVVSLYKNRIKTLNEFNELADCFFSDQYAVDAKGEEKHLKPKEAKEILREFTARLEKIKDFSHTAIEEECRSMASEKGVKAGQIIHPTRMAISGKTQGAGLFEMMEVMGKDKVIERMRKAYL